MTAEEIFDSRLPTGRGTTTEEARASQNRLPPSASQTGTGRKRSASVKTPWIGQLLAKLGVIDARDLAAMSGPQGILSQGGPHGLGVHLIEMGLTTSEAYLSALSGYFGLPVLSLRNFILCPSRQRRIGEAYAERNGIVVTACGDDHIQVALGDPDISIMDELKRILGSRVRLDVFLADPREIARCFRKQEDPYSMNFYR